VTNESLQGLVFHEEDNSNASPRRHGLLPTSRDDFGREKSAVVADRGFGASFERIGGATHAGRRGAM
jgi:hypothetical protein